MLQYNCFRKELVMPPKAKFTRAEIIDAGLAILRKRNMAAVTAREIGNSLGSSPRPIFTVFENMSEVIEGIEQKAREIYSDYIRRGYPAGLGAGYRLQGRRQGVYPVFDGGTEAVSAPVYAKTNG